MYGKKPIRSGQDGNFNTFTNVIFITIPQKYQILHFWLTSCILKYKFMDFEAIFMLNEDCLESQDIVVEFIDTGSKYKW